MAAGIPDTQVRAAPTGEARLLAACRREPVDATPVWFMRQAGGPLPGYRELVERHTIPGIVRSPELAARVALMPVEAYGVDGAVLYADIMLPVAAMGIEVRIDPAVGPIIGAPIERAADVDRLRPIDPGRDVAFVPEAVRQLRPALGGRAAVIGIAGAPFTLAAYLVEGAPSRDQARARAFMLREPEAWARLLDRLTDMTIDYLRAQVEAGAQVVQLFDSWAGSLAAAEYRRHVLPHVTRILASLRDVPAVHFATGSAHLLEAMAEAGGAVLGVDHRLPLSQVRRRVGPNLAVQGNLDPARLLAGWGATEEGAREVLADAGGRPGHVFNLGHAVLPGTDPALLARLVEYVHAHGSVEARR